MSLFKILRGASSRISKNITPFHDGYAYFTPDDGGFYIDALVGEEEKRILVNPKSEAIFGTLTADGWENSQQTVLIDGLAAEQNGIISIPHTASSSELEAVRAAEMYICGQTDGALTIAYQGDAPTCDIPVVVILID